MKHLDLLNIEAERAYLRVISHAKHLIGTLSEKPLRQVLELNNQTTIKTSRIIYEFIAPLIYARLECSNKGSYSIHYGYEQTERYTKYYPLTSAFIRSIYRYTAKENTKINIEDCVHTDWVVINCSELFEYIGDRNKYHTFRIIDYIPIPSIQLTVNSIE